MKTHRIVIALLFVAVAAVVDADDNFCPCIPTSFQWIVTPCDTWNCASSAAILANGDPYVMAFPTGSNDHKWVVLRRVATGSAVTSPDSPFLVDSHRTLSEAVAQYSTIDHDALPMIMTAVNGEMLVVRLREPQKRRSVTR